MAIIKLPLAQALKMLLAYVTEKNKSLIVKSFYSLEISAKI